MILKSFRNASHSLFIKILFGAIIFSFCLWGVGDIIKNYSASKSVFTINKTKLTVDQFLREYSQEKQRIRNIGSKPLSDAEMEKLNIKGMVLDKLVNSAVLDQTYNKLNIIVPKKSLIDIVQSLPDFQNNGGFDSRIYEMAIRRSGISEQGFLMQIRDNVARTQLIHPIVAGYKLPNFVKDCIAKEFEAKNTILVSKLDLNSVKYNKKISEDELKQYYDSNSKKYQKPESRDVSILVIDYKNLAANIKIDENEVNKFYEEGKNSYTAKESRDFERFVFDEKKNADRAWNMMNGGLPSAEIIKELTPDMENIKNTHASDFPTQISKELFELKLQKTSEVYPISGKHYIYRLVKVSKEKQKSETEIKSEIRQELQNDKMNSPEFYSKIKDMKNKIDDGFGSGKSIEEISKETGMKIVKLSGFQKSIENSDLKKFVPDEDTRTEIMDTIFTTDEHQVSQTIDSKESDTLSYVVMVNGIQKSMIPEFNKIKVQVEHDYTIEKKEKSALEDINEIIGMNQRATKELKKKYSVKTFKFSKKDLILNKDHSHKEVEGVLNEISNPNVVLNIISTLKSGEVNYYKVSDNVYIFVGIDKIEKAQNSSKEFLDVISKYVDTGTANDVVPVALTAFKKNLKVDIDHKLIDEITKQDDQRGED